MSTSTQNTQLRVLAIGLDGGTFYLLREWIDEGYLPNLARLIENGVSSDLESTTPPITAAAWTSFVTGKNPGKHGLVDFIAPKENSYDASLASSQTRKAAPLWNILDKHNRRSCIIGMPMTYPPEVLNGCMITGFLTPGRNVEYTYPPELKDELENNVGVFPFVPSEVNRFGTPDLFLRDMETCVKTRTETALYLMQKEDWNFFSIVYSSVDTVQHELWPLLDKADPRHNSEERAKWNTNILQYYQTVDNAVGQLVEAFGEDALVLIMSDHGFGPCLYYFHANNWLHKLGLMKFKKNPLSQLKYLFWKIGLTPLNTLKVLQAIGLGWLRSNVKSGKGYGLLSLIYLSLLDVSWKETKAFASGSYNKIYLNLIGKRPQGIVYAGEEYEALRTVIKEEALKLKNPITGQPVFQNVHYPEEIYTGPYVQDMPDLILESSQFEYFGFGHADFGSNNIVEDNFGQPGDHRMNGIFIISGPQIEAGSKLDAPAMIDLAPTILYAMGLAVPKSMDGRVLQSVFTQEAQKALPLEFVDDDELDSGIDSQSGYTEEEEELIRQRLRDLGYMA